MGPGCVLQSLAPLARVTSPNKWRSAPLPLTPYALVYSIGCVGGQNLLLTKDVLMNWLIFVIAGLFEIGWAIGLKYTEGFTRLWPTVGTALSMMLSVGLLGIAMKSLPVGTAYAVWVGVGAVGTAILGIVLFDEPVTMARLVSLALILAGIIGLKLSISFS